MKIFVVNCGSSSIKYQLFDMTDEHVLAKGVVERVGSNEASLTHTAKNKTTPRNVVAPDHNAGMKAVLDALLDKEIGVLDSIDEIDAIGHRVLHGGEKLCQPVLIDSKVIEIIRSLFQLGPLHMPPNLMGIEAAMAAMPSKPNVAVFDTAFLATLPPKAYRYAVPEHWYTEHHVRKYGFHGTSHRYVTARAAELMGKPESQVNLITVHLGNGCSMTSVVNGKAVDHSMGLTPLEGLMMGTRSGDLDPAVIFYMAAQDMSCDQIDKALNKESGLLGVSGYSNDMRDLLLAVDGGNEKAALAVEMFVYRIIKYIGSYYAIMPSVDAVVLTGGIGENSLPVREKLCKALARLGATFDPQRNEKTIRGVAGPLSTDEASLPVWVVPTNEELMIARDTREVALG
jgi:acetate kinase